MGVNDYPTEQLWSDFFSRLWELYFVSYCNIHYLDVILSCSIVFDDDLVCLTLTWCVWRWPGVFDAGPVCLTLARCVWRWPSVFDAGPVCLTLARCVWRWPGVFDAGLVCLTLARCVWRWPGVFDAGPVCLTLTWCMCFGLGYMTRTNICVHLTLAWLKGMWSSTSVVWWSQSTMKTLTLKMAFQLKNWDPSTPGGSLALMAERGL